MEAIVSGGGAAGERVRSVEWSKTPLGPFDSWPESLKALVRTLLRAQQPTLLLWGVERVQLYNDAFISRLPKSGHPRAMGQRGRDCWGALWPALCAHVDAAMSPAGDGGEGAPDTALRSLRFCPALSDDGAVAGVLAVGSEIEGGASPERVDLADLCRSAVEVVHTLLDARNHTLVQKLPIEQVWVQGPPARTEQKIVNLLSNAVKYAPAGARLSLSLLCEEGEATVRTSDGGELAMRLAPPAEDPGRPSEADDEPALRVLVVDDSLDVADMMTSMLEASGHAVTTAHDGVEALAAAARDRPDVVLLDLGLPRLDGLEVARRLRADERFRDVLLVALSGYGELEDKERTREAGFDHHLVKPVNFDAMFKILEARARRASV